MPWAIVHDPLESAGLNIPNLYAEQLISQIMMLLWYGLSTVESTGVLLRALAKAMQLEMGLAGEIMETPGIFKPVITPTWLKRLWIDCQ